MNNYTYKGNIVVICKVLNTLEHHYACVCLLELYHFTTILFNFIVITVFNEM